MPLAVAGSGIMPASVTAPTIVLTMELARVWAGLGPGSMHETIRNELNQTLIAAHGNSAYFLIAMTQLRTEHRKRAEIGLVFPPRLAQIERDNCHHGFRWRFAYGRTFQPGKQAVECRGIRFRDKVFL